ncbi:MAG: ABC transporter permease [Solirubrobacteraceae bacterium]
MSAVAQAPRSGGLAAEPPPASWSVRLRSRPWGGWALGAFVVGYLIWSLAPVLIAFLFSFNAGHSRSVWQGFSTEWWTGPGSVFNNPLYLDAILHSFLLAGIAVVVSVPLGVSLAVFLGRWRGVATRPASLLATLPLVIPELVLALALFFLVTKLLHFVAVGTPGQVVGQVTYILPLVIVVTRGRLASLPSGFEEAALDLGATPLGAFRLVLVPLLAPAILASAIVAFAVSIDDFVITQYMSSSSSTQSVPMVIYNSTRGSASPALNASAMVMAVTTIVICGLGYLVYRVLNRRETIALPQASTESAAIGPALSEGVW